MKDYVAEIKAWDWENIKREAIDNAIDNYEHSYIEYGYFVGRCFLGTVYALYPHGHVNVTEAEAEEDEAFCDALEQVAAQHGMGIEHGEGDPCDLFAVVYFDEEEIREVIRNLPDED